MALNFFRSTAPINGVIPERLFRPDVTLRRYQRYYSFLFRPSHTFSRGSGSNSTAFNSGRLREFATLHPYWYVPFEVSGHFGSNNILVTFFNLESMRDCEDV